MKLEQHLSDIEAVGEDQSTFTKEELDTIFKKTQAEMDSIYLETLSYYVRRAKKKRQPKSMTCKQLITELEALSETIEVNYQADYKGPDSGVMGFVVTEGPRTTMARFVDKLRVLGHSFGWDLPVYLQDDCGDKVPLTKEKILIQHKPWLEVK